MPEETGSTGDPFGAPGHDPAMQGWTEADRKSFWAFHEDRHKLYLRFAYLELGSDGDAEEAVDLTFEKIMGCWRRMLGMEHPERYAWTILKRRIIDQQRARRRRPEPADVAAFEAALGDGADAYEVLTGTIHFYTAVRRLSERQRDAVVLYYGLDCDTRETARVMGCDEGTVRSQLRRARARLLQMLDAPGHPHGDGTNPHGDGKVRA